jgi:CRISPR/Cas system-associated protein Cas10 (large subunit of type III CRISPR-Cas system)
MSGKKKMILSREEIDQFEALETRKDSLEFEMRNMMRNLMKLHEEDLEKLSAERTALWNNLYTKFGLDSENHSYSLNRETGEVKLRKEESDEEDDSDDESEDCGDPNCTACAIKRTIKAKIKAGPPGPNSLNELIQAIGAVVEKARAGDDSDGVKVRMPGGLFSVPKKGNPTVH